VLLSSRNLRLSTNLPLSELQKLTDKKKWSGAVNTIFCQGIDMAVELDQPDAFGFLFFDSLKGSGNQASFSLKALFAVKQHHHPNVL
jgi:hypothetical protein